MTIDGSQFCGKPSAGKLTQIEASSKCASIGAELPAPKTLEDWKGLLDATRRGLGNPFWTAYQQENSTFKNMYTKEVVGTEYSSQKFPLKKS